MCCGYEKVQIIVGFLDFFLNFISIISTFSTRLKAFPMVHTQRLVNFDSMAMQIFSLQVPWWIINIVLRDLAKSTNQRVQINWIGIEETVPRAHQKDYCFF